MVKISNNFASFEGFQKVLGGKYQNVTDEFLSKVVPLNNNGTNNNNTSLGLLEGRGIVQNMTHQKLGEGGEEKNNNTIEVVQEKTQNNHTASQEIPTDEVPPNDSKKISTNDSIKEVKNYDDKFMDGLLASGFDESTCLSRYQSHLYRKVSPYKPSPYLISKLRNYEQIHKKCGPNTIAYNTTMAKIIIPSSSETDDHHHYNDNVSDATLCKYVVWSPANGLGNRMISIAATFLYAVLTERVLLVRFEPDMHGLFCEPFQDSTWILPMDSPFWNNENIETYQSVLGKEDNARNLTLDQLSLPSVLFIDLQFRPEDPERFFHCDHNQEALNKVDVLIIQSDQYFVPSLFMIPSFSVDLNKMFPEKDAVFHHVGRYLFHPSNDAWGQITRFYDAYLAKADERIGLQVRVFNPASIPQQAVVNLLLSCAIENKILPGIDTQNPASNAKNTNHTLKAVLVASLYPEYAENLRTMYLKGPTVTGEVIGIYQPSHEEEQKFNDNVHNIKALVDMYLLSLCDVLVTTSVSTFGYVAHGFGGLKPWLLYRLTSDETHSPACVRDYSPEPCYHFGPQHQCNGKPEQHFGTSFPHIFECKDFDRGVKLVDGV
ncbi:hypothetical protein PIB30_100721 [Stylosanthes scabra]|uniref:Fucosyltransferase n=1 Tax=Stylosanthes scabra TaxID=79078 RepID=A0ABU6UWQ2_9FABA|nr:hypothetical protein [Stylosanthes scabra]